jgi:hypothetical protein
MRTALRTLHNIVWLFGNLATHTEDVLWNAQQRIERLHTLWFPRYPHIRSTRPRPKEETE